jgi:tyrosine-protein kinase Etk/Wzc
VRQQSTSCIKEDGMAQELSFSELWAVLLRGWRFVAKAIVAAFAISMAVAFLVPPEYSAEAVIFTPQQSQPSLSAMAQLAGVGGGGGGLSGLSLLSGFGLRNSADLYIGILESRTIADHLITKFDLKRIYHVKDFYLARKRLTKNTTIKSGKDTLIRVKVQDRDAQRSAEIANAYVEELSSQNANVALTEATQRRLFFEGQLVKEKNLLADAEIGMRDTQVNTGLVSLGGQPEALLRSVAQLRAEIMSRQAQLKGMQIYVADDNPRLKMVQSELGALQGELSQLEKGAHVAGTPEVPVGQLPQAGLEYVRKYRDLKYHEALYEILAKQYEAARLDEAKAGGVVQIIDRAVVPERKSWPPRAIWVLVTTGFAAFAAGFWLLAKNNAQRPPA